MTYTVSVLSVDRLYHLTSHDNRIAQKPSASGGVSRLLRRWCVPLGTHHPFALTWRVIRHSTDRGGAIDRR